MKGDHVFPQANPMGFHCSGTLPSPETSGSESSQTPLNGTAPHDGSCSSTTHTKAEIKINLQNP